MAAANRGWGAGEWAWQDGGAETNWGRKILHRGTQRSWTGNKNHNMSKSNTEITKDKYIQS